MDKQFGIAVILILLGLGLTQLDTGETNSFLVGIGIGTAAIASFWIVLTIVRDVRRR